VILPLLIGMASAELAPPSLEQHLADHTWSLVRIELDAGNAKQALATLNAFSTHVTDAPNLHTLAARAHIALADRTSAKREYSTAAGAAPDYTLAWFSLGELHSEDAEWAEADIAWAHVECLLPNGPDADVGPRRRAAAAAHQGNANAFETHVREAIRRGFDLTDVLASDEWHAFYANPALQDSVRQMITVYAGPEAMERLERPLRPTP
jgi:tetratricopeptide (TPR) repeat protein